MKRFIVLGLALGVVIGFSVSAFAQPPVSYKPVKPLSCFVVVAPFYQGQPSYGVVNAIQYDPATKKAIGTSTNLVSTSPNGAVILQLASGKNWRVNAYRSNDIPPYALIYDAAGSNDFPNLSNNQAVIINMNPTGKSPTTPPVTQHQG